MCIQTLDPQIEKKISSTIWNWSWGDIDDDDDQGGDVDYDGFDQKQPQCKGRSAIICGSWSNQNTCLPHTLINHNYNEDGDDGDDDGDDDVMSNHFLKMLPLSL